MLFWAFGLHRRARVACALDPGSAPKVISKIHCLECFCAPAPLGLPWLPKVVPRVGAAFWVNLAGFVDLLAAFLACLWVLWAFFWCFLGSLGDYWGSFGVPCVALGCFMGHPWRSLLWLGLLVRVSFYFSSSLSIYAQVCCQAGVENLRWVPLGCLLGVSWTSLVARFSCWALLALLASLLASRRQHESYPVFFPLVAVPRFLSHDSSIEMPPAVLLWSTLLKYSHGFPSCITQYVICYILCWVL